MQKIPVSKQKDSLIGDKVLTMACEKALFGQEMTPKEIQQEMALTTQFVEKQLERRSFLEKNLSEQKSLSKDPTLGGRYLSL